MGKNHALKYFLRLFHKPVVKVKSIWLKDMMNLLKNNGEPTLGVQLSIHNPNRMNVEIKKITYIIHKISGDGEDVIIATGETDESSGSIVIPANDSATMEAYVAISLGGVGSVCKSFLQQWGKVDYKIVGNISIGKGEKSVMTFPYKTRASFDIMKKSNSKQQQPPQQEEQQDRGAGIGNFFLNQQQKLATTR